MKYPFRGRTALACALAGAWTVSACTTGLDEAGPGSDVATFEVAPDATCPVTTPMSPGRYPQALRDHDGKNTWYGDGQLWVDLAGFFDASLVDDTVRAKHAWWTVDSSGETTTNDVPPTVRATRLDGPGTAVATVSGHSDDRDSWWVTKLALPEQTCWLVTGELDDTVVRVVVKAR